MNATLPPSKRSRVEREMDLLILFMFALLLAMCLIGAITFAYWTHHLSPNYWSGHKHCYYIIPGIRAHRGAVLPTSSLNMGRSW